MFIDRLHLNVLREVSRSESGLIPFTLHRRFNLGPAQLANIVRQLATKEFLTFDEDGLRIRVTDRGFMILSRFSGGLDLGYAIGEYKFPDWISGGKLPINHPYIPRIRRVQV